MPDSGTICYVFIVPDNVCKKSPSFAFSSHSLRFHTENVRNNNTICNWRRTNVRNTGTRAVYRRVSWENQKCERSQRNDAGGAVGKVRSFLLHRKPIICWNTSGSTAGLSLDELFGLENPVGSPEKLTKQIHHVELENAKLEAATALQSAQIRSTHTMCYVLALFCLLLSFSLVACLVTDAQIRNAGLIRVGDLTVTACACIALIVGSVLASAITFYAIRKERGGKHGVHQV